MKLSAQGLQAILAYEGFRENAYIPVPGDIPTIGYGFTKGVKMGDHMTRAQADARFGREIGEYEAGVVEAVHGSATQHQFDALVSFAWNVGVPRMAGSTVVKAHNRGDVQAAANAYSLWNKAGGKAIAGLKRRRAAEAAMYLTPDADQPSHVMPQTVDAESKMTASPINISSTVAAGSAIMVAATQTLGVVKDFKESLAGLGEWMVPLLCVVIVAAAGFTVWQRIAQRRGGWA